MLLLPGCSTARWVRPGLRALAWPGHPRLRGCHGQGETVFHSLFRMAWELKLPSLPVYGTGQNRLPTIHAADLAQIVATVARQSPENRYIVAVDDSRLTLQEITEAISRGLGPGKTHRCGSARQSGGARLRPPNALRACVRQRSGGGCPPGRLHNPGRVRTADPEPPL
jgi:nucleoside-diphosphate-sugar epimerase